MGYDIFNAIAHLAMIILAGEIFFLLTVPTLAIALGGLLGLRIARRRLAGPLGQARALPPRAYSMIDRACTLSARPVIISTSTWRGAKAAMAALRRRPRSTMVVGAVPEIVVPPEP